MNYQLLTVVMPAYNERATIRAAVERVLKAPLPLPVEVVVADDGSTDGTADALADLNDGVQVRVLRHDRNRGKGAAVRAGIQHARGDVLAILDADLEYDPADYAHLLEPLLNGDARVAYGTRLFGAHTAFSFWYVLGNKVINFFASFLYDTWLSDLSTCLKVADTELWRSIDLRKDGFSFDAEATAKFLLAGERIFETPIRYRARSRSEGKKVKLADGLRHIRTLLELRFGPGARRFRGSQR